ncbi:MAG: L-lactate dehydrogenase [Deltaproteobacteria bacterium]|nr:L-lactate dehydrogenase [Deltaproteobacteria bacterium]
MLDSDSHKVVVIGAGHVGATFSFALMKSGVAPNIIVVNRTIEQAEGQVMDLNHGLSFVPPSRIEVGGYEDCKDADLVVITAGAAQKEGETRLDLVHKNTEIFKDIIPRIAKRNPAIILVVSNPVDILTYVALKISGFAANRVIGSGTILDTARFRFLLSRHCRVDPHNVHGYIVGEHGDSEVPVWSQVNIAGLALKDYCSTCQRNCSDKERETIFEQVKNAAYEIVRRKGYTNFAVSLALTRIVGSILRNENSVLTVSSLLENDYDINDVCLSIPVVLNRKGVSKHIGIKLNETEQRKLRHSARTLKEIIGQIDL